jgi:hypothetical protein
LVPGSRWPSSEMTSNAAECYDCPMFAGALLLAGLAVTASSPFADPSPEYSAPVLEDSKTPAVTSPERDSLIRRAADAALDFSETLPNYVCREVISRFYNRNGAWRQLDTVETDLVYRNGLEDYRNITVNGKRVTKKVEETGPWSIGEFGTVLRNLFVPETMTEFQFLKTSRIDGVDARQYSFSVKQERSMWSVHVEADFYKPAYRGKIWIDPSNARTLRIEMEATGFPADFPVNRAEITAEYGSVRLSGTAQFLLPVRAAMLECQRGSIPPICFRNEIDFRDYRKFEAESSIQYSEVKSSIQYEAPVATPEPGDVIVRRTPPAPEPAPAATAAEPPSPPSAARIRQDADLPLGASPERDSLIRRAADAALDFSETLPNYVCREVISRFQNTDRDADWRLLDTVEADLVYEDGLENYRDIAVNGRRVNKMEEVGDAWSTGEFGTVLRHLFATDTMTEFQLLETSRIAGVDAREYSFTVKQDLSMWNVRVESRSYHPAYSGRIWIDPSTARALRIEMEATAFPADFPVDRVETTTDYEYVRLSGTTRYLLPVRASMLGCQRGTLTCFRNNIDFRNYRKFEAESKIQYENPRQHLF